MNPRRLIPGLAVSLMALVLATDLALSLFVVSNKEIVWRPVPPFGAITYPPQEEWLRKQREELAGMRKSEGIGRFDPLLGWSHRPGVTGMKGQVTINERGLRGRHDYPDERPEGVVRIVACGDSFTFCEEVGDADSWPSILEAGREDTEVWNLGVGGYGTDQAFLRFQLMNTGEIDVLIVGLLLENIGRNVNRYRPRWYPRSDTPVTKPRYVPEGHGLRLVRQPYANREELVVAVENGSVLADLEEHEYWSDDHLPDWLEWSGLARLYAGSRVYRDRELARLWSDPEGEPFQVTLRLLESFRAKGEERGAQRFLVVIFPIESDVREYLASGRRYWSTLVDVLEDRQMDHIDVVELLRDPWSRGEAVFIGTHLSPGSNRRVAEAVDLWLGRE